MCEELEEPRQYIGRSYWNRLVYQPGIPVPHAHSCPICFLRFPCQQDCALEPDLEYTDGTPSGYHVCCSALCAANNDEYLADAYGTEIPPTAYRGPPPEQLALTFEPELGVQEKL